MISCNSLWGKWKIVWKAWWWWWNGWIGCIFVLEVGWLERMHGRDTALNVDSCNATTMHSLRHQQFNFCSLFNLFKFFLSRVFLCFSIMLAFKYHSAFPVICVGQLKDKSLKVGIVGIIIRWCVCAGSTTPTSRDPSQSRTLPQRESIRTQVIRIHIEATRQPTNAENDPIRSDRYEHEHEVTYYVQQTTQSSGFYNTT